MAEQPQLSPKREKAITKVKRVEDGLLTAQASIGSMIRDCQEVRSMLEGTDAASPEAEEKKGEGDPDVSD